MKNMSEEIVPRGGGDDRGERCTRLDDLMDTGSAIRQRIADMGNHLRRLAEQMQTTADQIRDMMHELDEQ